MSRVADIYRPNLAALTDLYELTMGAGYDAAGVAEREAVFALSFRSLPFGGGYAVAAGLDDALGILENFRFATPDIDYLRGLRGAAGQPLFAPGFLELLAALRFTCDVDAIPEGTVVFANEPLVGSAVRSSRLSWSRACCSTVIGFQTLVATKAARVVEAAGGGPILEFGLRRAQGPDGAMSAARAAYIGGVSATSNVLAGRLYGIPVRGTHAHSWVQVFGDEQAAFDAYADAQPDNITLLVDTYDSLTGVGAGHRDGPEIGPAAGRSTASGSTPATSPISRSRPAACWTRPASSRPRSSPPTISTSTPSSRCANRAPASTSGASEPSSTPAFDQPALGAVYKLTAVREADGAWRYPVKLSEQTFQDLDPGRAGRPPLHRRHRPVPGRHDLRRRHAARSTAASIVDPADALHMRVNRPTLGDRGAGAAGHARRQARRRRPRPWRKSAARATHSSAAFIRRYAVC